MIDRRDMLFAVSAAAITGLAGYRGGAAEPGQFVDLGRMPSPFIAPVQVTVWLPPGYAASRERYGVVYMHDGQNLFDPARSNFNKVWAADKSAMRLIASGAVNPFIIVGIDHPGADRGRQYMPQAIVDKLPPDIRSKLERQGDGKPIISDAYLRFIVDTLRPAINRRFRTRTGRRDTVIAGSSMGGLISLYAIARHPGIFGKAAALSTHWPLAAPDWSRAESEKIFAAWQDFVTHDLGRPRRRHIWFDHGTETLDRFYEPYQQVVDAALIANGWKRDRDFASRVYSSAAHEENAWAARLDEVFGWLLDRNM